MPINAGTVYVDVKPDTSAMTKKGGGLSTAMKTAGVVAAGAFAVSFAKGAISEAKEAEKAGLAFADSLSRGTESFNADKMSSQFDKINNALNVSDEDLQKWASHFNNAIDFTAFGKNAEDMLTKMTSLVPNLAAASGKSTSMVEKAVKTIGTSPEASVTALRKLGALTDEEAAKAAKMLKAGKTTAAQQFIVANAYKNTAGAAAKQQTASEKLSLQWAELQETAGKFLLPILNQVAAAGMKVINFLTSGSSQSRIVLYAIGALVAGLVALKLATVAQGIATNATMVITKAWSAAMKIATAAQWLWNAAMSANPIGLIVLAVIGLIALIVILWKKNETFRKIVLAVWGAVKTYIMAVWSAIKSAAELVFKAIGLYIKAWWTAVKMIFNGAKTVLKAVWDPLYDAAKTIFNAIANMWNNTVGRLSFKAPSWVPGIGGNGFEVPDIPVMAEGGIVTRPTLALIGEAGPEAVVPLNRGGFVGGSTVRIVDSNLGLVMTGVVEDDKRYGESRGRMGR
jgi:hypothetical protein